MKYTGNKFIYIGGDTIYSNENNLINFIAGKIYNEIKEIDFKDLIDDNTLVLESEYKISLFVDLKCFIKIENDCAIQELLSMRMNLN